MRANTLGRGPIHVFTAIFKFVHVSNTWQVTNVFNCKAADIAGLSLKLMTLRKVARNTHSFKESRKIAQRSRKGKVICLIKWIRTKLTRKKRAGCYLGRYFLTATTTRSTWETKTHWRMPVSRWHSRSATWKWDQKVAPQVL